MTRKLVFVSYARADEPEHPGEGEVRWLTFVLGYLKAAFFGMDVEVFTDEGLAGGADWNATIERELRRCDAFVLLVSPYSMTSSFVVENEIAVIRAREQADDAPQFVPILLAPTPEGALELIRAKNWRPRGDKTLWEYKLPERARKMKEAADEIARELKARDARRALLSDQQSSGDLTPHVEQPRAADVGANRFAQTAERASSGQHRNFQVYISYARRDDQPFGGDGFVTHLRDRLREQLIDLGATAIDLWCDVANIEETDPFAPIPDEQIAASHLMLVVMSPNWLNSIYCKREVEQFAKRWGGEGEAKLRTRYKVLRKRPNDRTTWPAILQGQMGMAFFPGDTDNQNSLENSYYWNGKVRNPDAYFKLVTKLADIIVKDASRLREDHAGGASQALPQ